MTYEEATTRHGVTLVEFYANWCPHCRYMKPIVEEVRELAAGTAAIAQFDIDEHPREAEHAGAESVPTFIVYRDGLEIWRHVGEISRDKLLAALQITQ